MLKPNEYVLNYIILISHSSHHYSILDLSHALCACSNALFYLFVFWFSVIMLKSDI